MNEIKRKIFTEITVVPEFLQGNHFRSLDGLRAVAVLFVILYHFGINQFLKPFHLFIYGRIGVDIFFVISGFLITTLLLKEKIKTGKIFLKHFYVRRLLRIVPVVYLFLVVLVIIYVFCNYKIHGLDFITAFLFLKNMPLASGPYTTHLWSLAIEMQFYLIFPALLAHNVEKYLIITLTIVVIVPLIAILGFFHFGWLFTNPVLFQFTKLCMYSFWNGPVIILIGSIFSILVFKGIISIKANKKNFYLSFILLLAAIIIHTTTFVFYTKYISETLAAIMVAYTIVLTLSTDDFLSMALNTGFLVRIGVLSYSMYVWQQLFIGTSNVQPWLHFCKGYPYAAVFIFKLAIVFLISTLSYNIFEKQFFAFKQKFK